MDYVTKLETVYQISALTGLIEAEEILKPRGRVQERIYGLLLAYKGEWISLAEIANKPEFIGISYAQIEKSAQELDRKGLIYYKVTTDKGLTGVFVRSVAVPEKEIPTTPLMTAKIELSQLTYYAQTTLLPEIGKLGQALPNKPSEEQLKVVKRGIKEIRRIVDNWGKLSFEQVLPGLARLDQCNNDPLELKSVLQSQAFREEMSILRKEVPKRFLSGNVDLEEGEVRPEDKKAYEAASNKIIEAIKKLSDISGLIINIKDKKETVKDIEKYLKGGGPNFDPWSPEGAAKEPIQAMLRALHFQASLVLSPYIPGGEIMTRDGPVDTGVYGLKDATAKMNKGLISFKKGWTKITSLKRAFAKANELYGDLYRTAEKAGALRNKFVSSVFYRAARGAKISDKQRAVIEKIIRGMSESVSEESSFGIILDLIKTARSASRALPILGDVLSKLLDILDDKYPRLKLTNAEKSATLLHRVKQVDTTNIADSNLNNAFISIRRYSKTPKLKSLVEALSSIILAIERLTWQEDGTFTFEIEPLQKLAQRLAQQTP